MGKLILVPTPVGNLEDMTHRAVRVLSEVNLILAEDTRKSGVLLKHFGISTPMRSYHKFNEHKAVAGITVQIEEGKQVALITDAGTPGISDPGYLLVRKCLDEGIEVESLPGATAFIPALVNSGLPCDKFVFEGFLPQKKGRQKRIKELAEEPRTIVFYESPYRIVKLLEQLIELLEDDRQISISRELTKLHEETVRGSLSEVLSHFKNHQPRGEFVVVLAGNAG